MNASDITKDCILLNATVPICCLSNPLLDDVCKTSDCASVKFTTVNVAIENGLIKSISNSKCRSSTERYTGTIFNIEGKIVLPTFVDIHTHLDKCNTIYRSPNQNGTWENALQVAFDDRLNFNSVELKLRAEFGLLCAYHHGTSAIRTHIVSTSDYEYTRMVWEVFQSLKRDWKGRIDLNYVIFIAPPNEFNDQGQAKEIAQFCKSLGGEILGTSFTGITGLQDENGTSPLCQITKHSMTHQAPCKDANFYQQLQNFFKIAIELDMDVDIHLDEHGDGLSDCLLLLVKCCHEMKFQRNIVASHCCSLALASSTLLSDTLVALQSCPNISIVSLPMCNLYLQDHIPQRTPIWRGIPPVWELRNSNIPVAFASDNMRDAFYPYGDLDVLEVFTYACRTAQVHNDNTIADWIDSVTTIPSDIFYNTYKNTHQNSGVTGNTHGRLTVGSSANFIIFNCYTFNDLLSRCHSDRVVVRNGSRLKSILPDYAYLQRQLEACTSVSLSSNPTNLNDASSHASYNSSLPMNDDTNASKKENNPNIHQVPIIDIGPLLKHYTKNIQNTGNRKRHFSNISNISMTSEPTIAEETDVEVEDTLKKEVEAKIWHTASTIGFFQICNYGFPIHFINKSFELSKKFFALDLAVKQRVAFQSLLNCGYEYFQQKRLSGNGFVDQKESYQITLHNMVASGSPLTSLWPDEAALPTFTSHFTTLATHCHQLSLLVLSSISEYLGYDSEYFDSFFDAAERDCQTTLRLLHYPPSTTSTTTAGDAHEEKRDGSSTGRRFGAAPHTDWSCLTLLFQHEDGGDGLEIFVPHSEVEDGTTIANDGSSSKSNAPISPADTSTSTTNDTADNVYNGVRGRWIPVPPVPGVVTVNIGDMMMYWSNGQLKSTPHRVLCPEERPRPPGSTGRYSIAYFMQANRSVPLHKFCFPKYKQVGDEAKGTLPPSRPLEEEAVTITAGEFIGMKLLENYL